MKRKTTWVLVADGARARILKKTAGSIENATGMDYVGDNMKDYDLITDAPGRCFDSMGAGRHAYEPPISHHDQQKFDFAKKMCEELGRCQADFDELILISPPKILGEIRAKLCKQTLEKVVAEIPKDLTHHTDREVFEFLEKEF